MVIFEGIFSRGPFLGNNEFVFWFVEVVTRHFTKWLHQNISEWKDYLFYLSGKQNNIL